MAKIPPYDLLFRVKKELVLKGVFFRGKINKAYFLFVKSFPKNFFITS